MALADGLLFGQWLTDEFVLDELVRDFADPALGLAVILSEGASKAPDGVHRPWIKAVNLVNNPDSPAHNSWDLGLWQLNTYYHPVGDLVAYDPYLSTEYAQKLSRNGTDYRRWVGYTSGGYLKHLPRARLAWSKLNGLP